MAKLGHVPPQIRGSTGTTGNNQGSIRNGLKDKFVLNIIESFNDESNVLKELSNMRITNKRSKKRSSLASLKKTWSSIVNLAVGVPLPPSNNTDRSPNPSSSSGGSTAGAERMYSALTGYKSQSTACIAAL
eukprot:sb/3475053/